MQTRQYLIEEWKTSDEVVKAVESRGNQVLGVVTEELHHGEHSKASVLKFRKGALLELSRLKVRLSRVEAEESVVVDGSDQEEHLGPAEGWNGINGSDTVWDSTEGKARGNVSREGESLRDDVSDNSEHGNTAVLELRNTVSVKRLLVNVLGQTKRVEESGRGDDTELVLVRHVEGGDRSGLVASRGEGSGGTSEEGSNAEFHFVLSVPSVNES
jgi:hypothetical protein